MINKTSKTLKIAIWGAATLIVAVVFLGITPAKAQSNQCQFENQFKKLTDLQNNPLPDEMDNIRAELKIRKDMLNEIVDCSANDNQKLQSSLQNLLLPDDRAKTIDIRFSDGLNQAKDFLNLQKDRISGLGIQGTKNLALEIGDWRTSTYNPLSQKTTNFIIWAKNQNLIQTAEDRFNQINKEIKLLSMNEDPEVKTIIQKAQNNLQLVQTNNDNAESAFEKSDPKDDSLSYIKSSLESLADTYQNFFDLSDVISKKK